MNLPYSFSSNKLGALDSALTDVPLDGKNKSFPTQSYGSTSSSHAQAYNVGSPSPPLNARVFAANSNMNSSLNGSFAAPSPLTMPQYPLQNQQQHSQTQHQLQHTGHNNLISNMQMHTQIMPSELSHLQLLHQHQNHQNPQSQNQSHQNHQKRQLNQNHLQPHHIQNQNDNRNLHSFGQYGQNQKVTSQQNYGFHEPGFENNHFQENSTSGMSREPVDGSKSSHSYSTHDVLVQDPQLRHLHHLPHTSQAHQNHMHIQHRQIQLDQQAHSAVHDPRLQEQVPHEHGHVDPGLQSSQLASQLGQNSNIALQLLHSPLGSESVLGLESTSKLGSLALNLISKMVSGTDDDGLKKKRGRPKKLILDPSTNLYIDSSHVNFKKLNKLLKQNTDGSIKQASPMESGLRFDSLNDQEMKQLLELKDRRGRPRKFPVEQTGITIKGVRVSGSMKARKKQMRVTTDPSNKVEKKKRGRPRTVV